jgi:hypothetical protein
VLWVRPQGETISVTGKRLDGNSAPLGVDFGGPGDTFQPGELRFPATGCWQVDAKTSDESLRFVVQIR